MTYMSCEAPQTAENLDCISEIYRQVHGEGVTEAELTQAKSKINSRMVLGSERPRGRLFTVGGNWLQRHEYRSVADDLAAVEAVTRQEIAAVLHKYSLAESTTVAIGPLESLERARASA